MLIIGPEASTAALVGATIVPLAMGDHNKAVILACMIALLVGFFLMIAGIARLGFIANFIPKQVLIGFMTALGIIIMTEQLDKILGLSLVSENPFPILKELFYRVNEFHIPTLIVALTSLLIIYFFSTYFSWLPGQLLVIIFAIIAVKFFHIDQFGI